LRRQKNRQSIAWLRRRGRRKTIDLSRRFSLRDLIALGVKEANFAAYPLTVGKGAATLSRDFIALTTLTASDIQ